MGVPVAILPRLDPGRDRIVTTAPDGATIAQIIAENLPGLRGSPAGSEYIRVVIDGNIIYPEVWHRTRPKSGARVVITAFVPEGDNLRTVLSLVVAVTAIALGQYYLGPLIAEGLGITSQFGIGAVKTLTTAAIAIAGNLLINAFIPVRKNEDAAKQSPTLSGFQNVLNPRGITP